jgi:class 3 adenylate cyclase/pimeloyl-ACP methyl ester carboxylesterase
MVEPQIRYARTTDGVNIAYFTMGEGVPFVSVHLPFSNVQHELATPRFSPQQQAIAAQAMLVRYDHRGLGLSDKWPHEVTTQDFLRDLEAVVDKLELRRFILFANHGAAYPIAFAYAAAHPERVLAIAALLGGLAADFMGVVTDMPGADWRFISDAIGRRAAGADDAVGAAEMANDLRAATDQDGLRRLNAWWFSAKEKVDAEAVKARTLLLPTMSSSDEPLGNARALAARMPNAIVQPIRGETQSARTLETVAAVQMFLTGRQETRVTEEPRPPEIATATGTSAVILITDIADSTALTEALGDSRFRDASRALDAGLRAAIHECGGTTVEAKTLGDGVLATFGSAAQAIEGARRCLALSAASELGLHIGVHAGDVIREEGNVFGGAVNIAARICSLSAAGEILVSDVVRGMARSSAGVVFENRGEREMKGVGEPVRVYAVVATNDG